MPAKLGILVVHGMGSQKNPHFADKIDEVNGRLEDLGFNHHDLAWQPVYWADILQPQENRLWKSLSISGPTEFESMRTSVRL